MTTVPAGRPDRLVVVVGTGTGVGKTWIAAALLGRLRATGHRVSARKPAQSYDPGDDPAATDAAVLGRATGEPAEVVCPPDRWYAVAMAPPMAAEALGRPRLTLAELADVGWSVTEGSGAGPRPTGPAAGRSSVGLVETAGGVRSPQADDGDAVDLVRALAPDVVVLVAEAGLGTINAVRLCVDALAPVCRPAAGARLVAVLNRFDAACDLHRRNREWLAGRDGLSVVVVPGGEDGLAGVVLG